MKIKKKNSLSIPLKQFANPQDEKERKFIDSEKKYYHLIVALRQKREKLGFTQAQLAKASKIPRTTITKVESGSRNATLETIMALAEARGNSIELKLI